MSEIQKLISTNAAEPVWSDIDGQYYVQYENNGITYKIWVENAASLEEKLKVLQEKPACRRLLLETWFRAAFYLGHYH